MSVIKRISILVAMEEECKAVNKVLDLTEVPKDSTLAKALSPMIAYVNKDTTVYSICNGIANYITPSEMSSESKSKSTKQEKTKEEVKVEIETEQVEIEKEKEKEVEVMKLQRVGTQAAAISCWECIKQLNPDVIINSGTCGGIQSIHKYIDKTQPLPQIKQVFFGDKVYYHDRRIPIPPWNNGWDVGAYSCIRTPHLLEYIYTKSKHQI